MRAGLHYVAFNIAASALFLIALGLLYGLLGTLNMAEMALRVAQAGFVHDLPWGLDTRIGEQGLSLSGGQRQRLALALGRIGA